jgi:hypothetical protein
MANLDESRRVLVVDDEKGTSDTLTLIFRNHGGTSQLALECRCQLAFRYT